MCPAALPGLKGNKPPPGSSAHAAHTLGAQCPHLMPGVLNHQILLWSASHGKAFFQGRKHICYPNITSTYTNIPTHTGQGGRDMEKHSTHLYIHLDICAYMHTSTSLHTYKHWYIHTQTNFPTHIHICTYKRLGIYIPLTYMHASAHRKTCFYTHTSKCVSASIHTQTCL